MLKILEIDIGKCDCLQMILISRYLNPYGWVNYHYKKENGGARGVRVIVVGNGHGDTSSNPGRDWLHFK